MYRLSYLQAVEPDVLPRDGAVLVEVDPDLDGMGFSRVDLVADSREAIIEYAREHWGDEEDPQWFAEYVVGRITEPPISFAEYTADLNEWALSTMPEDHPDADRPPGTSGSWGEA